MSSLKQNQTVYKELKNKNLVLNIIMLNYFAKSFLYKIMLTCKLNNLIKYLSYENIKSSNGIIMSTKFG